MPMTIRIIVTKKRKSDKETYLCCGECGEGQLCRCGGCTLKEDALHQAIDPLVVAYLDERHLTRQQTPSTEEHRVSIWACEGRQGPWFVYRIDLGYKPKMNFISFCIDREGGNDGPVLG